jgi:hypothetical protein
VSQIAESLAPAFGNGAGAKSFGVALLIYSVVDGFLIGYIWTRIDLSNVAAEQQRTSTPSKRQQTRP